MNEKIKKVIKVVICFLVLISLLLLMSTYDIKELLVQYERIYLLIKNLFFVMRMVSRYSPLIVLIVIIILISVINKKFDLSVSTIEIAGMEFKVRNSKKIVINNLRNYLNTKRSIFSIDEKKDNYSEVLDSYHQIYVFFREQLGLLDGNLDADLYNELNEIIKEMNKFLTDYHTNFRHWFDSEDTQKKLERADIGCVQETYRHYDEMTNGMKQINKKMCQFAIKFEINYKKWL